LIHGEGDGVGDEKFSNKNKKENKRTQSGCEGKEKGEDVVKSSRTEERTGSS